MGEGRVRSFRGARRHAGHRLTNTKSFSPNVRGRRWRARNCLVIGSPHERTETNPHQTPPTRGREPVNTRQRHEAISRHNDTRAFPPTNATSIKSLAESTAGSSVHPPTSNVGSDSLPWRWLDLTLQCADAAGNTIIGFGTTQRPDARVRIPAVQGQTTSVRVTVSACLRVNGYDAQITNDDHAHAVRFGTR